ncbi:MAG: C10 family peptidase [Prevotella sp.]|nr:C10 family peptidase [Prevotella sp.]
MKKNLIFLYIFLAALLLPTALVAQADEISFTVSAPDTLEVGQEATFVYRLHTNEFSDVEFPLLRDFLPQGYGYPPYDSYSNKTRFRDFEWTINVVPYKSGLQDIVPMQVVVGGQKVASAPRQVYVKGRGGMFERQQLAVLHKLWNTTIHFSPNYDAKRPATTHPDELSVAARWLQEKGQRSSSIWLEEVSANADVVLFSDDWNGCFALVAKQKYQPLIGNTVLAYSLESSIEQHKELLSQYSEYLQHLAQSGTKEKAGTASALQQSSVLPLLGLNVWSQRSPYNMLMPKDGKGQNAPAGPGALACAQLLRYHQYPAAPRGERRYIGFDGKEYAMDFSGMAFSYDGMKDVYAENDTSAMAVASLVAVCAFALETKGTGTTSTRSAGFDNFKSVLTSNFGYSPRCRYYDDTDGDVMVTLLHRELSEGRPVLCKGLSNYFVCDGYDGHFFHFNMGWAGYFNGYYRVALPGAAERSPIIEAAIVGIEPDKGERFSKELVLQSPNTLATLLSEQEQVDVTDLKLSGKVGADDMALVRMMAGAMPKDNLYGLPGRLTALDLSDATFVTDKKKPYLQKDASGYTFTTVTTLSGYYGVISQTSSNVKLDEVSQSEWERIRREKAFKGKGYQFKGSDNSDLHVDFTLKKGIVTPYLFADCDNLQQIVIPKDTKSIEDAAFMNCKSLVSMELPPSVKEITEGCFMTCYQLRQVYYHRGKSPVTKQARHARLSLSGEDAKSLIMSGAFIGNNNLMCKKLVILGNSDK